MSPKTLLNSPLNPIRVLFVDDEPAFLQMLEGEFRKHKIEAIPASNGVEALFELSTMKKPIDLLITDFRMPEMDGLTLVSRLYSARPLLPIIFCSSYFPDECLKEVRQLSEGRFPIRCIEKPLPVRNICELIRGDVDSWRKWYRGKNDFNR